MQYINRFLHDAHDLSVLDLGCGTGLMGVEIHALCQHLVGVALAPNMLAQAQKKNIYSELAVADVEGYMRAQTDAGFDMVVAADVFVYRGELLEVFKQTHRILKHGGLFAFTVSADRVC